MIAQMLLMMQAGLSIGDMVLQPAGTEAPHSNWFGNDVAYDPPIAVVANRATSGGTVYVYSVADDGAVAFIEELVSGSSTPSFAFGSALAMDDGWLAIGKGGPGTVGPAGGVELFEWVGGQYVWRQELSGPSVSPPLASDEFGGHLALSGGTLVVGAIRGAGLTHAFAGYVEVFKLVGGGWVQTDHLVAPDGVQNDYFGYALETDGINVIVSAPFANSGNAVYDGAVYRYQLGTGGGLVHEERINPEIPRGAFFGLDIGLMGDVLVIGEPFTDGGFGAMHTLDLGSLPASRISTWNSARRVDAGKTFACDGRHILLGGSSSASWLELGPDANLTLLAKHPGVVAPSGWGASGFGWDVAMRFPVAIYGAPFYWDAGGAGIDYGAFFTVIMGQRPVSIGGGQSQPGLPAPTLASTYVIPELPATLSCGFSTPGGVGALLIGGDSGAMTAIGCIRLWANPLGSLVIPIVLSPTQFQWEASLTFPSSLSGSDLVAQAVRIVPGAAGNCALEASGALSLRF